MKAQESLLKMARELEYKHPAIWKDHEGWNCQEFGENSFILGNNLKEAKEYFKEVAENRRKIEAEVEGWNQLHAEKYDE
jgi:hypothetical protein